MLKLRASEKWIESGYTLFAHEGPNGIQIERIARSLMLNKSGFYHYFGTIEIFFERLMTHHSDSADVLTKNIQESQHLDPGVLNALIKHKVVIMAQVQLLRAKSNPLFHSASEIVNQKIDKAILPLWARHIGLINNYDLAFRYCEIVRDMFYTRISFENFNYSFLHELATETKAIVEEIFKERDRLKKIPVNR